MSAGLNTYPEYDRPSATAINGATLSDIVYVTVIKSIFIEISHKTMGASATDEYCMIFRKISNGSARKIIPHRNCR